MVRMQKALICLLVLTCCFGTVATAQDQAPANTSARKVLRKVDPLYPTLAKSMHLGGTVRVMVTVAPDGGVKRVEPLGGHPLLVQAAETAISQWKYAPGSESRETVELHFTP